MANKNPPKPTAAAKRFSITPSKDPMKPSEADVIAFTARRRAENRLAEIRLQRELREVW